MRSIAFNLKIAGLLCSALCFDHASAFTRAISSPWLLVDMPHGGCRLEVSADGSGSIAYGAMPRWVQVKPNSFDFEQLAKMLWSKSYPQNGRTTELSRTGSVSFSGNDKLRLIDDKPYVISLIARAWQARALPKSSQETEDHAWVVKACALT